MVGGVRNLKTDLPKAYDRVTLALLRTTLEGAPEHLIKCVVRCNTDIYASFRAPGMSTEGFVWIGKGAPKWDPASPILFAAVLEVPKPLFETSWICGFGVPVGCTRLMVMAFVGDASVSGSALEQTRPTMGELRRYLEANGLSSQPTACSWAMTS